MNKIKISFIVAIVGTMTIFSACTKKEPKYSCDEKAHQYAKTHIAANQFITRDSLVKLERGLQFAVFRSLTPENKKRIYNEKIDLLLKTLSLSESEKRHLQSLKDYFETDMYDYGTEPPFLVTWKAKANNTLGWTDNMIQGMVGTWATPEELITMAGIGVLTKKGNDCTCNYDISCAGLGDCRGPDCSKTQGGCGITGTANCEGNCPEDRIKPGSSSEIAM